MRALQRAAAWLGGGLFAALFAVFLIQITARFIFNRPLPWTDELAVVLYVWVIVWAAAMVVPERDHVAFDLLWNLVSARTQRIMRALGWLMLGGLALVALPANWDYVKFMGREGTPVLDIPFSFVFFPLVLLLAMLVVRAVWALWTLRPTPAPPPDRTAR